MWTEQGLLVAPCCKRLQPDGTQIESSRYRRGDVRLARLNLCAVLEGRTAVWRPGHLPHARMALHLLDAQARMEGVSRSQSRQNDARTSRVGIERLRPLVQGR